MIDFNDEAVTWLIGWAFIGSTLGFFTIRNTPIWTIYEQMKQYLLSICVGIFFAFPSYYLLCHYEVFNIDVNIMLSGGISFAITDLIINLWPKLIDGSSNTVSKIIDTFIRKI